MLDCANGAMYKVAPEVARRLGADVIVINAEPNGRNINDRCGATHPASLSAAVVAHEADLGLAFDGDGDRVIAVDHLGNVVDGDRMLALAALQLRDEGQLTNDTVVVTVMSNLGFHKAMVSLGPRLTTAVETVPCGSLEVWHLGGEERSHSSTTSVPNRDGLWPVRRWPGTPRTAARFRPGNTLITSYPKCSSTSRSETGIRTSRRFAMRLPSICIAARLGRSSCSQLPEPCPGLVELQRCRLAQPRDNLASSCCPFPLHARRADRTWTSYVQSRRLSSPRAMVPTARSCPSRPICGGRWSC